MQKQNENEKIHRTNFFSKVDSNKLDEVLHPHFSSGWWPHLRFFKFVIDESENSRIYTLFY